MRALGMQRGSVRNLVLTEAFVLSGLGIGIGLILGILGLAIIAQLVYYRFRAWILLFVGAFGMDAYNPILSSLTP